MFELLSLIFGGALRLVPSVLDHFDKKNQRQHDKDMHALRIEELKVASELRQQEVEVKALGDASKAQTEMRFRPTGNWFIDFILAAVEAINATVRPIVTYFYVIFGVGLYKLASYKIMLDQGASWKDAVASLWGPTEWSIVLSIIGFWFVDRSLRRMQK